MSLALKTAFISSALVGGAWLVLGCDSGRSSVASEAGRPLGVDGAAGAPGESPVGLHGQLRVEGTEIVNQAGEPVRLKGASSMWLNWETDGYAENLEGLRWLRDHWNLSLIRAAIGIEPAGAYLSNPHKARAQLNRIVENAVTLGVYVIVDWHDHNAHEHQAEAEEFFAEAAEAFGDLPNVIYEPFNEPEKLSWQTQVKPYHEAVVRRIRAADPDNLIVLGTPNWSQFVDEAALAPLPGDNLLYTLHFYACSHDAWLRERGDAALAAGAALFVTEWGATHADGGTDGVVCLDEAQAWTDWMDARNLSWAAWKLDNCAEASCFFTSAAELGGGWGDAELQGHGAFVRDRMLE